MDDGAKHVQESDIPEYSLIVTGLGAALVLWFIFTVVRKLFVLALLIAVFIGAWMIWNDPALLLDAWTAMTGLFESHA